MSSSQEQLGFNFAPLKKRRTVKARARSTDPASSRDAAALIDCKSKHVEILDVLKQHHPRKLTVKEIADRLGKLANAISSRFVEMERQALIIRGSKDEWEAYKSKVRQVVWGLTDKRLKSQARRGTEDGN